MSKGLIRTAAEAEASRIAAKYATWKAILEVPRAPEFLVETIYVKAIGVLLDRIEELEGEVSGTTDT